MKRIIGILLCVFSISGILWAETLSIAQIDASSLLLSQEVDLYLSATDEGGDSIEGLELEDFSVFESPDGETYEPVPALKKLEAKPNKQQGIHILLLIDNSGSMYDTLSGAPTETVPEMRITHAKDAIRNFIDSSFNPRDVVSMASFNTFLTFHSEAIKDPSALEGLLDTIREPEKEQAYTELYHSLADSAVEMAGYRGRKVVVVLSDGENYPFFQHSGESHPDYGEELKTPEDVTRDYQMEGITLYAIHFGLSRDEYLGQIAVDTGGTVYDARNEEELSAVYRDIKRKIENEYRLTYRAAMIPSDRTHVKVEYTRGGEQVSASRYYFTSTIFGRPADPYPYLILLLIAAAVLVWVLLLLLRYRKLNSSAALSVLNAGYSTKVSSMTIPLTQNKTIIGGGERADLTISGLPSLRPEHATIVHDPKTGSYTLMGDSAITVNNRKVSGSKKLSDGDVVNVEGTTIVFEAGEETGKGKKKK